MDLIKLSYDNNTYILVRLSISLADAIQQYTNAHQNSLPDPTIIFQGNRGAIRFPNGKNYDFSLEQSENPYECIKQKGKSWEAIGKMTCCMQVKGKDDVYQRTKTRMAAVEKERRKNCTKLLAANGDEEEQQLDDYLSTANSNSNPNSNSNSNSNSNANVNTNANANSNVNFNSKSNSTTIITSGRSNNIHSHNHNNKHNSNTNNNINNNNHSDNNNHNNSNHNINNNKSHTNASEFDNINNNHNNKTHMNTSEFDNINNNHNNKVHTSTSEFDKIYVEYHKLHTYLQGIESRFRNLEHRFKQAIPGSKEYELLKRETFREYDRMNSDKKFHNARARHKSLHAKLTSIKEKILQHRDKDKKRKKM